MAKLKFEKQENKIIKKRNPKSLLLLAILLSNLVQVGLLIALLN